VTPSRPDYAFWAGATAAFPAAVYGLELADPSTYPKNGMRSALRLSGVLGFMSGFLYAYQRSSSACFFPASFLRLLTRPGAPFLVRFWGWTENVSLLSSLDSFLSPCLTVHRNVNANATWRSFRREPRRGYRFTANRTCRLMSRVSPTGTRRGANSSSTLCHGLLLCHLLPFI
jgi:hypothetical protein